MNMRTTGFGIALLMVMATVPLAAVQALPAPQGISSLPIGTDLTTGAPPSVGMEQVYYDEFDNGGRSTWAKSAPAQGAAYAVTFAGTMSVVSQGPAGSLGTGLAWTKTDRLALDATPHYFDVPAYKIDTKFRLIVGSIADGYRVMDNGEVVLDTRYDGQFIWLRITYKDASGAAAAEDLQKITGNRYYLINATVKLDSGGTRKVTYDVVDTTQTPWSVNHYTDKRVFDALTDYITFGDVSATNNYGKGQWQFIKVWGRSTANFLETFSDNDAHDWRIRADDAATFGVSDTTGRQTLNLVSADDDITFAVSHPFDYRRTCTQNPCGSDELWTITFDFRILSQNNYWLIAFANDQALLEVSDTTLSYYYVSDDLSHGTEVAVQGLTVGDWYSIRLQQTSIDSYDIYVNDPSTAVKSPVQFQFNNAEGTEAIRLGDFNGDNYGQAEWDNMRVVTQIGTSVGNGGASVDDDGDGLSAQFESNGQGQILWAEDFEPAGTEDRPEHHGWTFDAVTDGWEWGPANYGGGPSPGYADSANLIGTNLDGTYNLNLNDARATSPAIDFSNVPAGETPWLVYNIWYALFPTDPMNTGTLDECKVFVKVGNNAPVKLASYTGENQDGTDRWSHEEMDLLGNPEGNADVRLIFSITTNGDGQTDTGCYVDDIQILARTDKDAADLDGDGLNDGQEVYWAGTSPFAADTDGDAISDYDEVIGDEEVGISDTTVNSGGRANPLRIDVFYEMDRMCAAAEDPCTAWLDISPTVRTHVAANLAPHGIFVHFRNGDTIPYYAQAGYPCTLYTPPPNPPGPPVYTGTPGYPDLRNGFTDGNNNWHPGLKTWDNYWEVLILGDDCSDDPVYGYAPRSGSTCDSSLGYFGINQYSVVNERSGTDNTQNPPVNWHVGNDAGNVAWSIDEFDEILMHHEGGHAFGLCHPNLVWDQNTQRMEQVYEGLWMDGGEYTIYPYYSRTFASMHGYVDADWAKIDFGYLHA